MFQEFIKETEDFIFMDDKPEPADIIFVPGNGYPQMAELAAELYKKGYADYVLPSGRFSITKGCFGGVLFGNSRYSGEYKTEWEFLCDVLTRNGVPHHAILREDQATYTWENARLSRKVTDARGLKIKKAILCCKNYHTRRAFMYYQKAFPETEFFVCPACVDGITKENWRQTEEGITNVTGEIDRIIRQFSLMV